MTHQQKVVEMPEPVSTPPIPMHEPVMVKEVLAALAVEPGGRYVDCTAGGAGHAEAVLEAGQPGGSLLAIDADPNAVELAGARLARFGENVAVVEGNFRDVYAICNARAFSPVNGILFDLGLSSLQLADPGRGFSFQREGPLDMRFGPGQEVTAAYWVNEAEESDLADVLWRFGEERESRRIARAIVNRRPLRTTSEL